MNAYTKKTLLFLSAAGLVITAITLVIYDQLPQSSPVSSTRPALPGTFIESVKKTNSATILRSLQEEFNLISLMTASTTATSTVSEPDFDESLSTQL